MQAVTGSPLSPSVEYKEEKNLVVTWRQFEVYCQSLGNEIDLDGWTPKAVIGIGRGGWEVAAALSRFFKIPSGAFMCKSYEVDGVCQSVDLKKANDVTFIGLLEGPVLIVDDMADKGHTLKGTYEFIKEKYRIEDVKTATIFCKTMTTFFPDYYVETVDPETWIHLPNEVHERFDIRTLPREVRVKLSKNPELIAKLLENLPENPREKLTVNQMLLLLEQ